MPDTPKIDIRPDHWLIVQRILQEHVPQYEVWAFGSRAKWTAKEYSDLDLAIFADKPLPLGVSADLSNDFSESELPWRVDVVDWATTSDSFRKIIEKEKVVVQVPRDRHGTKIGRGWVTMSFSKLSEIADVVDSLHKTPKYSDRGNPMVRCTDVKYGRLKLDETFRVIDEVYEEFTRRYKPSRNDIVITRVGSYGITALVEDTNFCLGQNTSAIIPKINSHYLYAALNSPQVKNQIESSVVGSTQKTLSLKAINDLEIPRFDTAIEQRIGEIIGNLDDKIQLNCQINKTLEQIAQVIFKSWFVDFEPVKAKIAAKQNGQDPECAAMRAISGKTDEQLDQLSPDQRQQLATTTALFPDELVDSEFGEIPKGWEVSNLGKEIDFATGFAFKSKEFTDFGIRLARGDNVKEGYFYWADKARYWPVTTKDLAQHELKAGDILLGMDGSKVGKNWVKVRETDLPCLLVQRVARLRDKGVIGSSYLEILISSQKFKDYVELVKTGTSIPHISGKQIKDFKLARPEKNNEIFRYFEKLLLPLAHFVDKNVAESLSLSELRDALLPKLLSGEISLDDPKSFLETVTC